MEISPTSLMLKGKEMDITFLTTRALVRSEPAEVHRDTAMPPQTAAGSPQKQMTLKFLLKLCQKDI